MARRSEIVEVRTRLGKRQIETSKVISFPRGLMGFEDQRKFTLLQIRDDALFLILQSMTDPNLGILVGDPYAFLPEYRVKIGDAEQKMLQAKDAGEVTVLVTISIPPGHPERTALNLTGPILINHEARIGLQVPQADVNPPRVLLSLCPTTPDEQNASHAGNMASNSVESERNEAIDRADEAKPAPKGEGNAS